MKYNTLLVWMTLLLSYVVVHGQERSQQLQFIKLEAEREDSAYLQSVSDRLKALLETGEYRYVCVDQWAVEWMFVDQFVKGDPRLHLLLEFDASFWCPVHPDSTKSSSRNNYNAVMSYMLNMLREYNRNSQKTVSVLGLDFQPDLETPGIYDTWLLFPVNRQIIAFNEATLTDSLMALRDEWWNSDAVPANTLRMMNAHKKKLTKAIGYEYFTLWRHFFMRYGEYTSSHRRRSSEERQRQLLEDFSFIDKKLPGGKIIIGYDWLINTFLHKNIAQ